MPRLVERIQAAAAATATATASANATTSSPTLSTTTAVTTTNMNNAYIYNNNNNLNNNFEVHNGKMLLTPSVMNNDFVGSQVTTQSYNTPDNSSTAASSDSFGTQVSPISDFNDYYSVPVSSNNNNPNPADYYQPSQVSYSDCITSPTGLFPQGMDHFQAMMVEPNTPWMHGGDTSDNFWNENMLFLQQQLMNDNM